MEHKPLWVPPGPIDELLSIAALMEVRRRVRSVRTMFDSSSEGRHTANELITGLSAEIDKDISELVDRLRKAA